MTLLESLRPTLAELERYAEWASVNANLPITEPVVITIQTTGKAKRFGHFIEKSWRKGNKPVHEISLSAEDLNRAPLDVLQTLHHEMVHLTNCHNGVTDCSKSGRHNRQYASTAKLAGLDVAEPYDRHGYAHTTFCPALQAQIEDGFQPNATAFALARVLFANKPKAPTKYHKFICPDNCNTVARATPGTQLICGQCQSPMRIKL